MNHFSDKEYDNLRKDTAEVRNCITRYIGYIITVTGFSGLLKFVFNKEENTLGVLAILLIALIIITLLFEVIWYKFKSHNRFVGYMQLLMQEVDAIPYNSMSEEALDERDYIKNYKSHQRMSHKKGINDLYSWEFVISRLNNTYFHTKSKKKEKKAHLKAVSKSKFVFSVSDNLYPYIELKNHDRKFFKKIIYPLHLQRKSKPLLSNFISYLKYLFYADRKKVPEVLKIEQNYLVNGWRYPKKITQIAFSSVIIITVFFIFNLISDYQFVGFANISSAHFEGEVLNIYMLILAIVSILIFWIWKYVRGIKELTYGKYSIDYYCWMFFIFRVQLLNEKRLVPIYFSRAFIRYFKNNLYNRVVTENEEAFSENFGIEENQMLAYKDQLKSFEDFSTKKIQKIHSKIKKVFWKFHNTKKKSGQENDSNIKIAPKIFEEIKLKHVKTDISGDTKSQES